MGPIKVVTALLLLVGYTCAAPEILSNFDLADYSTNLDEPNYRLRDNVQPTYMRVHLDVFLNESRFDGEVEIDVQVLENVTQIVLHQNVVSIRGVDVLDSSGVPVPLATGDRTFEIDTYFEIIKLNFATTVVPGNYHITIKYLGRINENPLDRGFYKGYYYLGNEKREYATTQFQPYHARKAFPCFDEPQFKCKFVISITRDASLRESYSNMPISNVTVVGGRVRETFYPTPIISAYLIAFHVSDFVATNVTGTNAKPFQVISREGVTNQHGYAADVGVKITDHLDRYLNVNYYDMGQGEPMKNDHIALPDFPSGAMENWGMVNYREAYLLYDERNTNLIDKLFIATIIAHEMGHKWFGNLVTCFWWSNLWLNESFASYFEHFAADPADPYLELDDRFILGRVQSALNADASAGAPPMNLPSVASNPSISNHFGTSSYAKGASVLRMLEHFVGYDTFRNALRIYLQNNAYKIAYPTDMYNAFRTAVAQDPSFATTYPNIDIGAVFDNWVENPGSPVVQVDVNMSTGLITLTQERFLLSGAQSPDTIWQIPITWTHGGDPNFSNLKPSFVLTTRTGNITKAANHDWVILNLAQSGLYRVNYDDHNWEMIAHQLRNNRTVIHKLSRSQIVNDVLHFLRSGKLKAERAFDVLSFLKDETDYYVWAGALGQLDWLRLRLEHLPAAHAEFTNYLLELLEASVEHVGYEEGPNDSASLIQHRMQILNYACNLGHEGCVNNSLEKWNQFRANSNYLVPVNARRYVYCTGIRHGNASDYNFLFEKYNTSENTPDMVVMLRTLGCAKTESLIDDYLNQVMYNDRIRVHDKTNAFNYALQGNKDNLKFVLNHLYRNYDEIRRTYGGEARLVSNINALASYLTDFKDIEDFQRWLYSQQTALGTAFSAGVSVINSSMNNLVWGNEAALDIVTTLRRRNSSSAITASVTIILMSLFVKILC